MPQSRKKVPFSGKAKKQQLQVKKHRQHTSRSLGKNKTLLLGSEEESDTSQVQKLNFQPNRGSRHNPNRYVLQFQRETPEELREKKEAGRRKLVRAKEEELEIDIDSFFPPELDFPVRPPWDFSVSKEQLEAKEQRYFSEYLKDLEKKCTLAELSYFELNLETWRQLWRVLEMADIVLVIVDIRFPASMFPPSVYNHVTKKLEKDIIVVLNKIDLAPAPLVVAWKHYLREKFPKLHIITFTSYPSYNLRGNSENKAGLKVRRRKGKQRMAAEGAQKLFDACKDIVKDGVDLSLWQNKIHEESKMDYEDDSIDIGETVNVKHQDTSYEVHEKYKGGILTIGCIGQPNVGKSSLMNAIMGKKVVSVSRTPGHTKHFQTIFLTKNVRLCDCPGLVFPSKAPRVLQVLMGSFPIAQVREPFSTIQFLAERTDLVSLLKIKHPENDAEWSAMDICEGWAMKKGFYTAKAARLDAYRAANFLLRMALEGKISLCMTPPNYSKMKEDWAGHAEVASVEWVQAQSKGGEGEGPPEEWKVEAEEESEDESSIQSGDDDAADGTSEGGSITDSDDEDEDDDEEEKKKERKKNMSVTNKFQCLDVLD